ncbi:MAG: EAL domain-containing protein [Burkholderiaceae bacterium]|jgi:diguanylate cyclase (GGDEF)-like protein/PAS domain S-box-containing protein
MNSLTRPDAVAQLKDSTRFRMTFDHAPVGIAHLASNGQFMLANPKFCAMTGYSEDELLTMGIEQLVSAKDVEDLRELITSVLKQETPHANVIEKCITRKQDTPRWMVIAISVVRNDDGSPHHLIAVIEDIGSRKQTEQALAESEHFTRSTINALPKQICVIDENGRILSVNQEWRNFHAKQTPQGDAAAATAWESQSYLSLCDNTTGDAASGVQRLAAALREMLWGDRTEFRLEYSNHTPAEQQWLQVTATRFPGDGPRRLLIIHENITNARLEQERLAFLANHDSLTNLANRTTFCDRLKQSLLQAKRNRWTVGMLFLDLHQFKCINDTLGHMAGDQALQLAAERISGCLRGSETVGRLGGDQFGIVMPNIRSPLDAGLLADSIMNKLSEVFTISNTELRLGANIGISISNHEQQDADVLIQQADTAMYRSKALGKDNYLYFADQMSEELRQRVKLGAELRRALEHGELFLRYQPQIEIASGKIIGAEALVRWQHPERGLIAPSVFLPIAEESDLIVTISEWVLKTACEQNKKWQDAGLKRLVMSVNLSSRQLKRNNLGKVVQQVLSETGLPGQYLGLEITESTAMENAELLIEAMHHLKTLDVRISLDDFGTGYTNFAFLTRFPLDAIKIDRSFIECIGQGTNQDLIVSSIIKLAHNLNFKALAEGVESDAQLNFLRDHNCDSMQGFLFSRPMLGKELTRLLEAGLERDFIQS